jgi:AbrB family looped-hinge helix DNA binding protein
MKTQADTVKLTSKNQLTVPARVVRQLQLSAGDRLAYEVHEGVLILKPRSTITQQLQELWLDNAKVNKGVATDDSIRETLKEFHHNQPDRS